MFGDDNADSRVKLDFNIFFQNVRLSGVAPRQNETNPNNSLPEEIYFFVRLATYSDTTQSRWYFTRRCVAGCRVV